MWQMAVVVTAVAMKQQIQDPKGSEEEAKQSTDSGLQDRVQLLQGTDQWKGSHGRQH